jgi:hypothetical protein
LEQAEQVRQVALLELTAAIQYFLALHQQAVEQVAAKAQEQLRTVNQAVLVVVLILVTQLDQVTLHRLLHLKEATAA